MLRSTLKGIAVCALFAGLLLRAVTPLGYMPATLGSGLLFELCPGQLPASFVLPGAASSEHAHHHGTQEGEQPSPHTDQCDIGHLLFAAMAVDAAPAATSTPPQPPAAPAATHWLFTQLFRSTYQSRAPPA